MVVFPDFFTTLHGFNGGFMFFFYHFTNAGILQPYLMTGGPSEVATPRLITVIPKISTDSGAQWGPVGQRKSMSEFLGDFGDVNLLLVIFLVTY